MISTANRHNLVFPKGGWEDDEDIKDAACREALEEAGVKGILSVGFSTLHASAHRHAYSKIQKMNLWEFGSSKAKAERIVAVQQEVVEVICMQ